MTSSNAPTPAEMRQACQKIQANWSEKQEISRRGDAFKPRPVSLLTWDASQAEEAEDNEHADASADDQT